MPRNRRLPHFLEPSQWNAVLSKIDQGTPTGKRDLALYLLLWRTGMRIGEALALRDGDFDRRTGRIRLRTAEKPVEMLYAPVDAPRLRDALDVWQEVRDVWDADQASPYYFITRLGTEMSAEQVRQTLARRGRKAGIPIRVTPHMFRHSFAVELLREGFSLNEVQDALRHADISTTQIYLELIPNARQRLMQGRTDF